MERAVGPVTIWVLHVAAVDFDFKKNKLVYNYDYPGSRDSAHS